MLTLKQIRAQYQDPWYTTKNKTDIFSRYFYSSFATPIVKLLLVTKVTANQITIFWVSLGIISCLLLALGIYWVNIFALLLFQLHMVLDFVDGPIARAKGHKSLRGVYIERVGHDFIFAVYFYCIALGMIRDGFDARIFLTLGFCASIGNFFYKHTKRVKTYCLPVETGGKADSRTMEKNINRDVSLLRKIYRRSQIIWEPGFFTIASLPLAVFGLLWVVPIFYGLTYPLQFILSYIYQSIRLK